MKFNGIQRDHVLVHSFLSTWINQGFDSIWTAHFQIIDGDCKLRRIICIRTKLKTIFIQESK